MHTLEELQAHLEYQPNTGLFTWKAGGRKRKRGALAGYESNGYIRITFEYKAYLAHRLAWLFVHGSWPAQEIDHIDGDRQNNRVANLRDVSHAENLQGARVVSPRSKTGVTGVTWNKKSECYQASRMTNGKSKFLGLFDTIEEAAAAYANAENVPETGKTYRPRRASVAPQYPNL